MAAREIAEEMLKSRTAGATDWQPENAGVNIVRLVEEAVTAKFALGRVRTHVAIGHRHLASEPQGGEVQVASVGSDHGAVGTHRLEAIDGVGNGQDEGSPPFRLAPSDVHPRGPRGAPRPLPMP